MQSQHKTVLKTKCQNNSEGQAVSLENMERQCCRSELFFRLIAEGGESREMGVGQSLASDGWIGEAYQITPLKAWQAIGGYR